MSQSEVLELLRKEKFPLSLGEICDKMGDTSNTKKMSISEDLKKLLRRGKGDSGGKTTIFERLFSYSKQCGYRFKGKPSYQIEILNNIKFKKYIKSIVFYLKDHPNTTHIELELSLLISRVAYGKWVLVGF